MSTFTAPLISGHGRGRQLGFPTLNLEVGEGSPEDGVYAVRAVFFGRRANGVMHVGPRPTFKENDRSIEVHLIDFDQALPNRGECVAVEVLGRLRDIMSFPSTEALKKRIAQDIMEAASFF